MSGPNPDWSAVFQSEHSAYQPISVCEGSVPGSSDDGGKLKVTGAMDSYDFIWGAFERLAR